MLLSNNHWINSVLFNLNQHTDILLYDLFLYKSYFFYIIFFLPLLSSIILGFLGNFLKKKHNYLLVFHL